jgi:hypothetical protein
VLIKEPSGLITITGGKWTTYRRMAQDAVDAAVSSGRLPPATFCRTTHLRLLGGEHYHDTMHVDVAQRSRANFGVQLDGATCLHLVRTYGDQAYDVLRTGGAPLQQQLLPNLPLLLLLLPPLLLAAAGCRCCCCCCCCCCWQLLLPTIRSPCFLPRLCAASSPRPPPPAPAPPRRSQGAQPDGPAGGGPAGTGGRGGVLRARRVLQQA